MSTWSVKRQSRLLAGARGGGRNRWVGEQQKQRARLQIQAMEWSRTSTTKLGS
uniref:Uncharacterized protein n=1 Tax=Arundo donax TaxID=35708 RepID=A0A0A9A2Z2_ARUDO